MLAFLLALSLTLAGTGFAISPTTAFGDGIPGGGAHRTGFAAKLRGMLRHQLHSLHKGIAAAPPQQKKYKVPRQTPCIRV